MKSYNEFCSMAKALDVVGDRWALLVVRELLLGPRRYTDLLDGLPGIGTNVLSTRLRELEGAGVVERRRVPAPTPAVLYELADEGRDLRPVLDAIARWGARRLTRPASGDAVEARWFVLSLAANADPAQLDPGTSFALEIDGQPFTLRVDEHDVVATDVTNDEPTATITGKLRDFFPASKGDRAAAQRLTIDGDRPAAKRFIRALTGSMAGTR
jgi:DNA-binding HxlR family transcriptional regulator